MIHCMATNKLAMLFFSLFFCTYLIAQSKNWNTDPKWMQMKYGAWGGPGVEPKPGPMDTVLLKDYAPASSVVSQVTAIEKAKYPVVDVHSHVVAKTKQEIDEWVKTMNQVGIQTSVVLTGVTGLEFD